MMNNIQCATNDNDNAQAVSLSFNLNLNLSDLKEKLKINNNDLLYYYVLETVKMKGDELKQYGSGPNLEGNLLTLCTCKHSLRVSSFNDTKNVWVCGITKKSIGENRGNYLFYLAKIEKTFDSFYHIWNYLTNEQRKAKNMTLNYRGDILEPKDVLNNQSNFEDYFKLENYNLPKLDRHSHTENDFSALKKDVEYVKKNGKRPKYLTFEVQNTFIWNKPVIQLNVEKKFEDSKTANINQGYKIVSLREFLNVLSD